MNVEKLGSLQNNITLRVQNRQKKADGVSFSSAANEVCSPVAADALRAQNLPVANYKYLQDINIPALNLNGKLYRLPNGQKCLVAKKDGPAIIKTFFRVGSMNEPDNLRGISHFIEHNLFNGSKTLKPTEFVTKVNTLGGNYNASTGFTTTDYFIQSPLHKTDDLEKFIQIHADMLSNPLFTHEMIEKERGPVISEIQMLGDNPYNLATNTAIRNLFGIKSASPDLIGGSVENIKNVTRDDVINYYKSNYTPQDALTVVIGDVDEKKTMDLLSRNFAEFNNKKITQYHEKLYPLNNSVRKDLYSANTQATIIQLAFQGPKNEEDKTAVNALLTALAGYQNAKLSDALKDKTRQVEAQTEAISNEKLSPIALLFSVATTENNEEEILKIIYQKLHEMAYIPLTEQELTVLKNKMKMALNISAESNMSIASVLGANFISKGNFDSIINSERSINSLTSSDIMNAAKKYLDLNRVSVAVVHPKKPSQVSFGGSKKEDIKVYQTKNNAQITAQNIPSSKLYSLNLSFVNTNIYPQKSPVSVVLMKMLNKGNSLMDEKSYNSILDNNNITVNSAADTNILGYSLSFPKESLPNVLDVMNKSLNNPPLTKDNFEKAKAEIKEQFLSAPKEAINRAVETLYDGTPLSVSLRKSLEEIDSLKFEDVVSYYNLFMQNPELKVTLTGNLSDEKILNGIFYNISGRNTIYKPGSACADRGVKDLCETKVITEAQERNQADIIQLFRIKRTGNVKDDAAIKVLNEILGGNSNSRLFNDLREKQKLAYRVRSYCDNDIFNEGYIALNISTTTDGTDNPKQYENLQKSIDGFKYHIDKLINEKVSQEELKAAKLQIKSKREFFKESTPGKNGMLSSAMHTAYKTEYEKEFMNALDNVTPDDIQRIAAYYLTRPSVISVVASNSTIINNKDYLEKLGNYKKY